MKSCNLFVVFFSLTIGFCGCTSNPSHSISSPGLEITLNSDSSAIQLENISSAAYEALKTDTLTLKQWQSIFAVYEGKDAGQNGIQRPLDGTYQLSSSKIAFIPADRFQEGKTYQVECYIKKLQFEPEQIASGSQRLFKQQIIEKKIRF